MLKATSDNRFTCVSRWMVLRILTRASVSDRCNVGEVESWGAKLTSNLRLTPSAWREGGAAESFTNGSGTLSEICSGSINNGIGLSLGDKDASTSQPEEQIRSSLSRINHSTRYFPGPTSIVPCNVASPFASSSTTGTRKCCTK